MKKNIIVVLLVTATSFSQTTNIEKSPVVYKTTLISVNNTFLKKLFINNYYTNANYFKVTDLAKEDFTKDFIKSNLLLQSMQLSVTGDSLAMCKKGLEFNENYLKLYEIKNSNILSKKFDKETMNKTLSEIEKLAQLEENSNLDKTKIRIKKLLSEYADVTTILRQKLEIETNKNTDINNPLYKKIFTDFEKTYNEYPYLIKVIKETDKGKNKNSFQTDLYISEQTIALPKEAIPIKEAPASTTDKVKKPKTSKELREEADRVELQEKEAKKKVDIENKKTH